MTMRMQEDPSLTLPTFRVHHNPYATMFACRGYYIVLSISRIFLSIPNRFLHHTYALSFVFAVIYGSLISWSFLLCLSPNFNSSQLKCSVGPGTSSLRSFEHPNATIVLGSQEELWLVISFGSAIEPYFEICKSWQTG